MKRSLIAIALLTGLSTSAMASDTSWETKTKDAWIDGKAEATLLFNSNLNSFDINTDVKMGTVILTGGVNNEIEKELAEELVMGIDGVKDVDNMLSIVSTAEKPSEEEASQFTDAKINTVITSRLLFDSEVSGTSIDVDVDNREVTLNGTVESKTERDLAMAIAKNTDDVKSVVDNLKIQRDS